MSVLLLLFGVGLIVFGPQTQGRGDFWPSGDISDSYFSVTDTPTPGITAATTPMPTDSLVVLRPTHTPTVADYLGPSPTPTPLFSLSFSSTVSVSPDFWDDPALALIVPRIPFPVPATPTPVVSPTPTASPSLPLYRDPWPPDGWIAPHLQYGRARGVSVIKVFSCSQIITNSQQFVVVRMYGDNEGKEIDELPEEQILTTWLTRFENTFGECKEYIDAAEIFNEVSGNGDIARQRKVARVSFLIAQELVKWGIRPVVFNYPVTAPTVEDASLPEVVSLVRYVASVDGAVGVHVYFPCSGPSYPPSWQFAEVHKRVYAPAGIPVRYVATEAGICQVKSDGHWLPYEGWRTCPELDAKRYLSLLQEAIRESKRRGVSLRGMFVFTVSGPGQGWESFQAREVFPDVVWEQP